MTNHIEETKAKIAVMQAYVDGAPIEWARRNSAFSKMEFDPIWNWDECTYRIATTPDTIDWTHVSPEYKWMARDEGGEAYVFKNEPEAYSNAWTSNGYEPVCHLASYRRGTCDWKDSLVERYA